MRLGGVAGRARATPPGRAQVRVRLVLRHSVFLEDAVEVSDTPGVLVENVCIVEIAKGDGPIVGINHIVNGKGFGVKTGKDSGGGYAVQRLVRYCNGESEVRPDEYKKK